MVFVSRGGESQSFASSPVPVVRRCRSAKPFFALSVFHNRILLTFNTIYASPHSILVVPLGHDALRELLEEIILSSSIRSSCLLDEIQRQRYCVFFAQIRRKAFS